MQVHYTHHTISMHFPDIFHTIAKHFPHNVHKISIQFRCCFNTISILFQYNFNTISIQFQYILHTIYIQSPYNFHTRARLSTRRWPSARASSCGGAPMSKNGSFPMGVLTWTDSLAHRGLPFYCLTQIGCDRYILDASRLFSYQDYYLYVKNIDTNWM